MTITKSAAVAANNVLQGDFVRVASNVGAQITHLAGMGSIANTLAKGAFGRITAVNPDGSRTLTMHNLMPAEIASLQTITLSPGAQIERISLDNDNEAAVLGLQYMRDIKEILRTRINSAPGLGPLLVAAMKNDADRIAAALTQSGLHIVEEIKTVSTVHKRIFLTANPEAMREGAIPIDAVAFDFDPVDTNETKVEVYDASRATEILFTPERVSDGQTRPQTAQAAQQMPQLSPFMAGLLGMNNNAAAQATESDLNLGDLIGGGNDAEDDNDEDDHGYGGLRN